jgi:hypothetical protein
MVSCASLIVLENVVKKAELPGLVTEYRLKAWFFPSY